MHSAKEQMRHGEGRPEPHGFSEIGGRVVEPVQVAVRLPSKQVGLGIIGVKADRFGAMDEGATRIAGPRAAAFPQLARAGGGTSGAGRRSSAAAASTSSGGAAHGSSSVASQENSSVGAARSAERGGTAAAKIRGKSSASRRRASDSPCTTARSTSARTASPAARVQRSIPGRSRDRIAWISDSMGDGAAVNGGASPGSETGLSLWDMDGLV